MRYPGVIFGFSRDLAEGDGRRTHHEEAEVGGGLDEAGWMDRRLHPKIHRGPTRRSAGEWGGGEPCLRLGYGTSLDVARYCVENNEVGRVRQTFNAVSCVRVEETKAADEQRYVNNVANMFCASGVVAGIRNALLRV